MRAAILLACLVAGALPSPASAQVWSLGGRLNQRFEIDTNRPVDPVSQGFTYGSITNLGLDFGLRTKRSSWNLYAGAVARAFGGPGDTNNLNGVDPRINMKGAFDTPRTTTSLGFSLDVRPVSFVEFTDTGDIDADGVSRDANALRTRVAANAAFSLRVDQRNTLSFTGSGQVLRFSNSSDSLDPSSSTNFGVSWSRAVSPRTSVSLSSNVQFFQADDRQSTQYVNANVTLGFQRKLTPRFSLGGSAGVSGTRRWADTFTPFGTVERETQTNLGGVGSLNLTYRTPDTDYRLGASQSVDPSSDGELQNRTAANFGIVHRIDRRQRLTINGAVSQRSNIGSNSTSDSGLFFQFVPAYSYRLTEDWDASLSYRFRLRNDTDGTGISNAVILGITRDLAIFP